MTVNLSMLAGAGAQFFDNNGVILSGGLVYTYAAGTTTPQATYTTSSGSTAHTNPIVLDSAGRVASGGEIWLTDAVAYKFVLKTSAAITIATYDNITGNASGIVSSLAASSGSSLVGYLPSGANATATTVQAKLRQYVSVKDFGAVGDGTTDDTTAIQNAIAAVNAAGGGTIWFPTGIYITTTGINIGDGTNSTVSTKDNRITLRGAGSGTGTEVTGTQYTGATVIKYTGAAAGVGVVNIKGPVTLVQMFDMQLNCNSLAQFGIYQIHLYGGTFQNINVVNFTSIAYYLTTRTTYPFGCAYGNGENRYIGCFSNNPASFNTTGIYLTSGVDPATTLAGNPDSNRNTFIGGTYFYGGNTSQHGVLLNGADNNTFLGTFFIPAGGSSGGYDIYFQQWAGSGNFPLENYFSNIGMTRGVGGNGGIGSSYGNVIYPYNTGDGAAFPPAVTGVSGGDQLGRTFVAGVRSYRGRQISLAESQTTQSTSSTSFVDVTGYSITLTTLASKLKIEFSGSAIKNTSGEGYFVIVIDGLVYGPTQSVISSPGFYQNVTALYLIDLVAASHTVKIQFKSSDANTVSIVAGTLIVQELY